MKQEEGLMDIEEVAEKLGLSPVDLYGPILFHRERIPHVGEGYDLKFPPEALPVFEAIHQESLEEKARKLGTAPDGSPRETLTVSEMEQETAISKAELHKFVRLYGNRIPHIEGDGPLRFPLEAVEIFRKIKMEHIRRRRPPS